MSSRMYALDGLRGLALLCVLCAHAGAPLFGGSLIMFVLSGYLITSSLLAEYDQTGSIAIRAFYVRRVQRLMPALIVMLILVNLAVMLLRPAEASTLRTETLYTLLSLNNWAQMQHASALPVFAHLWSLSVQEQVYVVWPVAILLAIRISRRVLLSVCVGLAVGVCGLRAGLVLSGMPLTVVYLATCTRVEGVFLGAALATCLSMSPPWVRGSWSEDIAVNITSVGAVFIIGVCLCAYPMRSPLTYIVSMPVVSLCTTLLIAICILRPSAGVTRLLAHPVLVRIGTISYGAYLWHFPLIVLLSVHAVGHAKVIGAVCGLILGEVSYRVIEKPVLRSRRLSNELMRRYGVG